MLNEQLAPRKVKKAHSALGEHPAWISVNLLFINSIDRQYYTMSQFVYPDTRRDDTVFDTYGTEKVADPYQWLEDPDSEETQVRLSAIK